MKSLSKFIELESKRFNNELRSMPLLQQGELLKELASGIVARANALDAARTVNDPDAQLAAILQAYSNLCTIAGAATTMAQNIRDLLLADGILIDVQYQKNGSPYLRAQKQRGSTTVVQDAPSTVTDND
ncbi:MAG: hypothetical protein JNL32_02280 [Candidatus Kapabacteria bacterium]|nr:hypothetical protein [Candidatus Kapabacteria bacterium]